MRETPVDAEVSAAASTAAAVICVGTACRKMSGAGQVGENTAGGKFLDSGCGRDGSAARAGEDACGKALGKQPMQAAQERPKLGPGVVAQQEAVQVHGPRWGLMATADEGAKIEGGEAPSAVRAKVAWVMHLVPRMARLECAGRITKKITAYLPCSCAHDFCPKHKIEKNGFFPTVSQLAPHSARTSTSTLSFFKSRLRPGPPQPAL